MSFFFCKSWICDNFQFFNIYCNKFSCFSCYMLIMSNNKCDWLANKMNFVFSKKWLVFNNSTNLILPRNIFICKYSLNTFKSLSL